MICLKILWKRSRVLSKCEPLLSSLAVHYLNMKVSINACSFLPAYAKTVLWTFTVFPGAIQNIHLEKEKKTHTTKCNTFFKLGELLFFFFKMFTAVLICFVLVFRLKLKEQGFLALIIPANQELWVPWDNSKVRSSGWELEDIQVSYVSWLQIIIDGP